MTNKRKVLLVSSAFYPEISPRSFRATELAKEFCRQGLIVTVITKTRDFDYGDFTKEFPLNLKMMAPSRFPNIPAFNQKFLSFVARAFSRIVSVLFEYPAIEEMFQVKRILKLVSKHDLMISFAVPYPIHWGIARIKHRRERLSPIWIADCGDPYMFSRLDTFRKPFYFRYAEISFCKKCDYISVPFKEMMAQFYPQFTSKIRVIPQGVNFNEIKLYTGNVQNVKPTFVYAGSIIPGKRDLKLFIDFLSDITTDFSFIIYTNRPDWFYQNGKKLGNKLHVLDYIDRFSLIFQMSKADFLVNVDTVYDNKSNIEAIPSKLIDYALAKRPILNIMSDSLDSDLLIEFLNGNYTRQRRVDVYSYDIQKVALQFLSLKE